MVGHIYNILIILCSTLSLNSLVALSIIGGIPAIVRLLLLLLVQGELVVLGVPVRLVVQIRAIVLQFRVQLLLGHVRQRFERIVREHVLRLVDDVPAVPPGGSRLHRGHPHIGGVVDAGLGGSGSTQSLGSSVKRGTGTNIRIGDVVRGGLVGR